MAALKAAVGRLDLVEFAKASKGPGTFAELERVTGRDLGRTGLMLFIEFDQGAVLRKETGLDKPKMVRLLIGNPLVMKKMAKHVPDAASYAPVTVTRGRAAGRRSPFLRQDGELSQPLRKRRSVESCSRS